jgi:hypothetical protein
LINVGIGAGISTYTTFIPPLIASADFKLNSTNYPLMLGVFGAFNMLKYTNDVPGYYHTEVNLTDIGFGGRLSYHLNFFKKLDVYTALTLGYVIQLVDVKYERTSSSSDNLKMEVSPVSFFLIGFSEGARYFFTDKIGVYVDIGYNAMYTASFGISAAL